MDKTLLRNNKVINSVGVQSEIFFSDDGSIDDTKKFHKYKNCFDLTPKNLNVDRQQIFSVA